MYGYLYYCMPTLETIEDAKEVIRSRRSIDAQYNGLKKNDKKPNLQWFTKHNRKS